MADQAFTAAHQVSASTGSASTVAEALVSLRAAAGALTARPRATVLNVLGDVVDDWLQPESPLMARAVAELPGATGFSPQMIAFALPALIAPLRGEALQAVVAAQAGERSGPPLILHILPGNLPGLAAIPTALSLAIGSTALLKPGRGDQLFPDLFLESIAARDADLAAAARAVYWPGGDRACEDLALGAADLVVAAGDDASIASLAARASGRFIGHGHRVSFAVVTADAVDNTDVAAALAVDVATWDQRGCLSPQLCFVEGDFDRACDFGARVMAKLTELAQRLPPATMSLGDRLAVRRWRDEAEWAAFDGEPYRLFAADDEAAGTVVVEPAPAFRPTPLSRCLRVLALPSFASLAEILAPLRGILEGAGLAAAEAQWADRASDLDACGVHLVSRIGAMQRPPLGWRQGGRPRLAEWCVGGDRAA